MTKRRYSESGLSYSCEPEYSLWYATASSVYIGSVYADAVAGGWLALRGMRRRSPTTKADAIAWLERRAGLAASHTVHWRVEL